MTEIAWATIRERAIEQFGGQTPRAPDEDRIIDHFEHQPTVVIQAITEIAKADKVTWKWSALAARLDSASGPTRNPIVQTGATRAEQIRKADNWMRQAGMHFDRWPEVEDELFGSRGYLHEWRHQTKLVDKMRADWEAARPTGEQIDREELERAERWVRQRKALADKPRAAPAPGLPWKRTPVTAAITPDDLEPEPADYDYGQPNPPP